jgi:hypothetical protein
LLTPFDEKNAHPDSSSYTETNVHLLGMMLEFLHCLFQRIHFKPNMKSKLTVYFLEHGRFLFLFRKAKQLEDWVNCYLWLFSNSMNRFTFKLISSLLFKSQNRTLFLWSIWISLCAWHAYVTLPMKYENIIILIFFLYHWSKYSLVSFYFLRKKRRLSLIDLLFSVIFNKTKIILYLLDKKQV